MTLEPNLTWYVFRSFSALAVVLGLILVVAALARRYLPGLVDSQSSTLLGGRRHRAVEVLEVTPLDRQHRLALIKVDGRRVLVGFGGGQVNLVADSVDAPADTIDEAPDGRLEAVP